MRVGNSQLHALCLSMQLHGAVSAFEGLSDSRTTTRIATAVVAYDQPADGTAGAGEWSCLVPDLEAELQLLDVGGALTRPLTGSPPPAFGCGGLAVLAGGGVVRPIPPPFTKP